MVRPNGPEAVVMRWDWTGPHSLRDARRQVGDRVALQGNLDPCLLLAEPTQIEQAVQSICTDYGTGTGHIFNLGHGVLPQTPPENVRVLVDSVHSFSVQNKL